MGLDKSGKCMPQAQTAVKQNANDSDTNESYTKCKWQLEVHHQLEDCDVKVVPYSKQRYEKSMVLLLLFFPLMNFFPKK
jgi:hypothetical protein